MPWEIRQDNGRYCVYKEGDSDSLQCYDNEAEAKDYLAALYASEAKDDGAIGGGGYPAVKASGDWELDVLGVPFGGPNGGKDSDGEYFAPDTKTHTDSYTSPPVVYYHGFSPEGKPMGEPAIIGKVTKIWNDAKGWWYHVVLDKVSEFATRIWNSAREGKARASSGSIAHLVRKAPDGKIVNWPVVELSLIDADGKRQPANQYAVAMPAAQKLYKSAGIELPADNPSETEAEGAVSVADVSGENDTFIVTKDGVKWKLI